jgi:hypothetical protein
MCHEQKDKKCSFANANLYLENSRIFPAITDMIRENCLEIVAVEQAKIKEFEEELKDRVFNFESS